MISFVLPLLSSFINSGIYNYLFLPLLALCFIATVPCIIRILIRG